MTAPCRRIVLGLALLAFLLPGCGGPKVVKVQGKLFKNKKPLTFSPTTYVTLSFIPAGPEVAKEQISSHSAKFDHKTGAYSVSLPPGTYRVMVVIAPPGAPSAEGKLNAPRPIKLDRRFEVTQDQDLDIEVPP
jgi:hypothetical protein